MKKSILKMLIAPMFMLALFSLTSCDKEEVTNETEVENFTLASVDVVQRSAGCGKHGCFEFVFPITVSLPDSTTISADSYEALRTAIKDWKEANPDATERPTLVFPIELITDEGETLTVSTQEELKDLRSACRQNARGGRGNACFEIVFPISVEFPDATVVTYEDRAALKTGLRAWKQNNPDADEKPRLVFPITVELEDERQVEVASKEDLQTLKSECIN